MTSKIYLAGSQDGQTIRVSLESHAVLFLLEYCQSQSFHVTFVDCGQNADQGFVPVTKSSLSHLHYELSDPKVVPKVVSSCNLPVEYDGGDWVRSGLCCVLRYIVTVTHKQQPNDHLDDLLGFRRGCLRACSEVSGWTKLCEIEVPNAVRAFVCQVSAVSCQIGPESKKKGNIQIPVEIVKLDKHLEKHVVVHNNIKLKQKVLVALRDKWINNENNITETEIPDRNKWNEFLVDDIKLPHSHVTYALTKDVNDVVKAKNFKFSKLFKSLKVTDDGENKNCLDKVPNKSSKFGENDFKKRTENDVIIKDRVEVGNEYVSRNKCTQNCKHQSNNGNVNDNHVSSGFSTSMNGIVCNCEIDGDKSVCDCGEEIVNSSKIVQNNLTKQFDEKPSTCDESNILDKSNIYDTSSIPCESSIPGESTPNISDKSSIPCEPSIPSESSISDKSSITSDKLTCLKAYVNGIREDDIHLEHRYIEGTESSTSRESSIPGESSISDKSNITGDKLTCLKAYVNGIREDDIHLEHRYIEGTELTLSDIILYVFVYHFMHSLHRHNSHLPSLLPLLCRWFSHMANLPRIQSTSHCFNMVPIQSVEDSCSNLCTDWLHLVLPVYDADDENLQRIVKTKYRAIQPEIHDALTKLSSITPIVSPHPRNDPTLPWTILPQELHPIEGKLPPKRAARKYQQIESLVTAIVDIAQPGDVIVDFCAGGGHVGIVAAYLLPSCHVYLVENKDESLLYAKSRIDKLSLSNITIFQCNLEYFHGHFDIGVCLHACGVATDMVQSSCLNNRASMVICPCCYGAVQNTHLVTYPRSRLFKDAGLCLKDCLTLAHAADMTEVGTVKETVGKQCMNLVDWDRAQLAAEHGYSVTLTTLQPISCTPKHNLIIATPPT